MLALIPWSWCAPRPTVPVQTKYPPVITFLHSSLESDISQRSPNAVLEKKKKLNCFALSVQPLSRCARSKQGKTIDVKSKGLFVLK